MKGVVRLERLLFFGLVAMAAAFFAVLAGDISFWSRELEPAVPVKLSDWKVMAHDEAFQCGNAAESQACPAAKHTSLWASSSRLGHDLEWRARLREGITQTFWLRLDLDAESLAVVREKQANHFLLGKVFGDTRIWLNGDLAFFTTKEQRLGHMFQIPLTYLERSKSFSLTIEVIPKPGVQNVLPMMENLQEGFVTKRGWMATRGFLDFIDKTKAFTLFSAYFLLSVVFLSLWAFNPIAKEYKSLAALSLVNSLPELFLGESFRFQMPLSWNNNFLFLVITMKIFAILSLSWDFARVHYRKRFMVPIGAVLLGLSAFGPNALLLQIRSDYVKWGVSAAMLAGGLLCLVNALHGSGRGRITPLPAHRKTKLLAFSLISFTLAASYLFLYTPLAPNLWRQVLWGIPDLSFVAFLGSLAVTDYRKQKQLIESVPVSEYHKRPQMPERVPGVVFILDIKKSESIFRGEGLGTENLMPLIVTEIWKTLSRYGATILKAEGDEVIAFFEEGKVPSLMATVVSACGACAFALRDLATTLRPSLPDSFPDTILFRAAAAQGEVKPIWIGDGAARYPAWSQVGDTKAFVDAARLLEIERGAGQPDTHSQLVLSQALFFSAHKALVSSRGEVTEHESMYVGKHGRQYHVCVFGWNTTKATLEADLKIAA